LLFLGTVGKKRKSASSEGKKKKSLQGKEVYINPNGAGVALFLWEGGKGINLRWGVNGNKGNDFTLRRGKLKKRFKTSRFVASLRGGKKLQHTSERGGDIGR